MQHSEFEVGDEPDTCPASSSPMARRGGFRPVGFFARAVVMKLSSELPRIKVESASREDDRHSR